MAGREREYDPRVKNKILKELRRGRSPLEMSAASKIPVSTIRRWVHEAEEDGQPMLRFDGKPILAPRRSYTPEMKAEALAMLASGKSKADVLKKLNIKNKTLDMWVTERNGGSVIIGTEILEGTFAALKVKDDEIEKAKEVHMEAERQQEERIDDMVADALIWMQKYTETQDSHWREHGAESPYRPFPDKPYFRAAIDDCNVSPWCSSRNHAT